MSRKWERMVQKNTEKLNKQRAKFGRTPISEAESSKIRGRNWVGPILLVLVAIYYMLTFISTSNTSMYWVTAISYLLLAALFVFRRPFLEIDRKNLSTRRFSGFKSLGADDIDQIVIQKGYVIISAKDGKTRWVFSRLIQLYDIGMLSEKLQEFAKNHSIPVIHQTK
ncbi:hypothetical protein [Ferviditalea candida]|uniref:Methyltransferase n=1 Tax=Ferviditalea candida TaxID=3108399 RepID=A0ABU5ZN43_9BACL|nr:hypothetical protein [Paenibacillaceae bacterium T2]